MHDALMRASISYMLANSNVIIDGTVPLDFAKFPFVTEIIDEDAPRLTILKGAQMGFTIACIFKSLEWAKRGTMRGIGYYFPSEGEVSDFAKSRFKTMMEDNHELWGRYVEDTDSAALKKIGRTHLYFRGVGQKGTGSASRSLSRLKSIPNDGQVLDERDEMDDTRVDAVNHRMDASENPMQIVLSTPTLPGYGVDLDYKKSDQRVWMWKCGRCNDWTCLELDYPDCIVQPNGKDPYYQCHHCHKPQDREVGQWVARETNITDHRGYWVSQLSSLMSDAGKIILAQRKAIESGLMREFQNQTLARAFAYTDEQITEAQLTALLTSDPTPLEHEGPAALGCDPGKPCWYTVRIRVSEHDSVCIARGKVDTLGELDRVWKRFNCESGVIDKGYDPSAVDAFCRDHPGCYGGLYIGSKTSDPDWNHKEREVKMGRTRTLNASHQAILDKRVKHVQKDEFWIKHFVPQMMNLKRATFVVNERTGETRSEWVVTEGRKNDHLRHADAYAHLALERVGLTKELQRVAMRSSRQSARGSRRGVMTL